MTDKLEQLKKMTVVVADTGDINAIKQYFPQDATTNPSLILKASQMESYKRLVQDAVKWGKAQSGDPAEQLEGALDKLAVNFGKEILQIIPGRVSTEVDVRLSFDAEETVRRSRKLIELYEAEGISRDRVLIKIAATWEGIEAAKLLRKEKINCNLTLIFGFYQAVACAEAGVFIISPFVGRILDWHKKQENKEYTPENDPGVLSVKGIYEYYKKFNYPTIIMGASFRNNGEIQELAGCDYLTIGPNFMEELKQDSGKLERKLHPEMSLNKNIARIALNEKDFRWHLNQDAMATEKLAEGIRNFANDLVSLEKFVKQY